MNAPASTAAPLHDQSFKDRWFHMARAAGLVEVDGWFDRCVFRGDVFAWHRFHGALVAYRAGAKGGDATAATRAIQRVAGVIGT